MTYAKAKRIEIDGEERVVIPGVAGKKEIVLPRGHDETAPRYSASQFELADACLAKWAFERLLGFRQPATKAMLRGSAIHDRIEKWLIHGVSPGDDEYGRVTMPMLEHLPPRTAPGLVAEDSVAIAVYPDRENGPVLIGYEDAGTHDPAENFGWVYDGKTTSDKRYVKTPEQLLKDIQSGTYALARFDKYGYIPKGRWIYSLTKGKPKAFPVEFQHTEETLEAIVGRMEKIADALEDVKAKAAEQGGLSEKDLQAIGTPDSEQCEKYGGCFHRARCPTYALYKQGLVPKGAQRIFSLDASKADDVEGETAPEIPAKEETNHVGLIDRLKKNPTPAATAETPKTETPKEEPKVETKAETPASVAKDPEPAVNPPEAGKSPDDGGPAPAEKKGRGGRKPKTEEASAKTEEAPSEKLEPRPIASAHSTSGKPRVLYVGCRILGDAIPTAHAILRDLPAVEEDGSALADYSLAQYGRGPGLLRAALRKALDSGEIKLPAELEIDPRFPDQEAILPELSRRYATVIVGYTGAAGK